ncbi:MAG: cytochrome c [Pseudomonadota bacterium]|nr:cytochrome c [Pseudomonadota bacterium]
MNAARLILAGALLTSGYALYAKPVARSAAPSAAELVTARQAGMDMSASALTLLKNASTNGVPLKNLAFPAGGLAKWATALPTLFADSTKGAKSDAKPEVFTDRAGFGAKAQAYIDATKSLAAAAAADDKPAFDAALASTGAACKGCHDAFKVPPPAKPG